MNINSQPLEASLTVMTMAISDLLTSFEQTMRSLPYDPLKAKQDLEALLLTCTQTGFPVNDLRFCNHSKMLYSQHSRQPFFLMVTAFVSDPVFRRTHPFSFDDAQSLLLLFLKYGGDIDAVDEQGRSALHLMVGRETLPLAHFLLCQGANSSLMDIEGETAFHYAARNDSAAVNLFLSRPDFVAWDQLNHQGQNALYIAARWSGFNTSAESFIAHGRVTECPYSLSQGGLLFFLCDRMHFSLVKLLIAAGLSMESTNEQGQGLFEYMAAHGNDLFISWSIEQGLYPHMSKECVQKAIDLAHGGGEEISLTHQKTLTYLTHILQALCEKDALTQMLSDVGGLELHFTTLSASIDNPEPLSMPESSMLGQYSEALSRAVPYKSTESSNLEGSLRGRSVQPEKRRSL